MKIASCSPAKLSAVDALRETQRAGGPACKCAGQTVALSDVARQLAALSSSAQEVDLHKVQALREAIASGQFQVSASRIADNLIASARDLIK